MLGLNEVSEKKKVKCHLSSSSSSSSSSSTVTTSSASIATTNDESVDDMKPSGRFSGLRDTVKIRLLALSSEVLLRRSSSSLTWVVKKQRCQRRRKVGVDEELAAFSLMAMSYGLVFA